MPEEIQIFNLKVKILLTFTPHMTGRHLRDEKSTNGVNCLNRGSRKCMPVLSLGNQPQLLPLPPLFLRGGVFWGLGGRWT